MKALFCIAATLAVLWIADAAPQPLFNTTISEMKDLTTASVSEHISTDKFPSTPRDEVSISTDSGGDTPESSAASLNAREEPDISTRGFDIKPGPTLEPESDSTEVKLSSDSSEASDTRTSTETPFSKAAEDEESVSESEIPITRYVPPLDPMKHMLLMADVKGFPNLSNLMPKVNFKPVRTTEASVSSEGDPSIEDVSGENSDIIEKVVSESLEGENNSEKIENNAAPESSSEGTFDESTEKIEDGTTEKVIENSTENVSAESTEKPVDVSTEKIFEESSSETVAEDLMEKVVAESSEVDENRETLMAETTVSEEFPSSTVLLKADAEISDLKSETSLDYSSTESIPTSTFKEATTDVTGKPEVRETSALHRNSEAELKSEEVTTEGTEEKSTIETETTTAIFSSTEEVIKVNPVTNSDELLKNVDLKSEATLIENEKTTESSFDLKDSETTTAKETKDILSTTISSTAIVPETTFESSMTASGSEKRNISLDDELEFRAVKIPQMNASKVSYVRPEPVTELDLLVTPDPFTTSKQFSDETVSEIDAETELTTTSIFTTIAELLFSSSTTNVPDDLTKESNDERSTATTERPSEVTELPLPLEKLDIEAGSDTGTVLSNDSPDMLKVQSVTTGLDSVPAKETTTFVPPTEKTTAEIPLDELMNDEFTAITEREPIDEEKLEKVKLDETTVQADTTTIPPSSSTTEITTKSSTTTVATTTTSASVIVTEMEELELKSAVTLENESDAKNESAIEEKPSDYLLNIRDRYVSGDNRDMVAAVQFLHYHDKASSEQCFKLVDAHWNYATNLTEENKKKQLEQTLEYSLFHKAAWKNATSFAWKTFNDTLLRRWFKSLSVLGTAALPEDKLNEFNRLKAEMKNKYSTAKTCTYVPIENARRGQILREKDCNLTLEPDLVRILTKSRDYDELVHVWKSWRDAAGKPIREKYLRFVELSNEAARMNGFSDTGDMWREAYESETFETDLEEIWDQLKPLYEHLHAYVRRRLIQEYGSDKIKEDGPIPAHLFGNMWAQSWVSLLDITQPFPGKPSVDVTPIMEAKNMTAYEMFKIAEEFFISLGLKPMPEPFWEHSLIEKPKDREIICHASAWDFCNGKDYRIKQCTDITMEDLITVHHEMGHVEYFLQYARQPNVFREGANPGFHEAIGDVLALSVSTPKHLKSIGLLDEVSDDPEGDLNFLIYTALDKVSFLPSGYLIDLWRWGLFSGDIKPEEMNTKWWELRLKYQGVCPPVKRTDTDFDPGAKFHVPGNVPYIRYFVSFVIQFQFHKVLCDAAGHTGPLYKCDIYRSAEAGQILSQVMELGSSEHWSEAMKIMTGGATNKMDAGPILEYFEPLLDYLKEQNQNETLGWRSSDATICP